MPTATRSLILIFALTASAGAQTAMWGGSPGRNQAADEKNLPTTWNTETGENIQWHATLGSQTYGGPLIAGDKIFVGTNNQAERDPNHKGDRGVVMAFNRADGAFSLANRPSQAAGRPRQRLATAGRLLDSFYLRRPPLLCLQPRRSRMPRHRGLPRRRERRPHLRRNRHRAHQRGSDLENST